MAQGSVKVPEEGSVGHRPRVKMYEEWLSQISRHFMQNAYLVSAVGTIHHTNGTNVRKVKHQCEAVGGWRDDIESIRNASLVNEDKDKQIKKDREGT